VVGANQAHARRREGKCGTSVSGLARLSDLQKESFYRDGYLHLPNVVPAPLARAALRAINEDVGRGLDPGRMEEFYARSFCPELRRSAVIVDLFQASAARELAEGLVGKGALRAPEIGQIALRFPGCGQGSPLRPHVDGTHGPKNGVPAGSVHHFTMLAMVALSDAQQDFAGNFTVWPGSHRLYERYFQTHEVTDMLRGTPRLSELPTPTQLRVRMGDLVLAHYELGHAGAPNLSPSIRYAVFFRLYHREHDQAGLDILGDLWREYPGVRALGLS